MVKNQIWTDTYHTVWYGLWHSILFDIYCQYRRQSSQIRFVVKESMRDQIEEELKW